jgi:hypothetical protein
MTSSSISDAELLAYLDEMLSPERAAVVEKELRSSSGLRQQANILARRRDQGGHTVGEIWRRERLSCLSRSQLGSYLLGTLDDGLASYIQFHLQTVGCRICAANLRDIETAHQNTEVQSRQRRRKYFESSAGMLRSQ